MKKSNLIALIISLMLILSASPVFAASIGSDANNKNIGSDFIQGAETTYSNLEPGTANTSVYLSVDSSNMVVSVPTIVIISGTPNDLGEYIGKYSVSVDGDFAGNEIINILPLQDEISLSQIGKINTTASINQSKTSFTVEDILNGDNIGVGTITAKGLTAGIWSSSFTEEITMSKNTIPYGYKSLYKYDISATDKDNVALYYCVPKSNTQPIVNSLSLNSLEYTEESDYVDLDGIRYYLSNDDIIVIQGSGNMRESIFETLTTDNLTVPEKVIVNNGVTNISKKAFYNCPNLKSITLPDTVISIGASAFRGCSSLKSIYVPDSVTFLDREAFADCTSLTSAYIGNNVSGIPIQCFSGDSNLSQVTLGKSIKAILYNAFTGCNNITQVNFLGTADDWAMMSIDSDAPNPASIAGDLYINGELLTDLNLTTATNINKRVFKELKSLKTVHIPDTVNSIGASSFRGCSNLNTIIIPDSVTNLEREAFADCTSLTSAYIGNNVSGIPIQCFSGDSNLSQVTLGKSIKGILFHAFSGCNNISKVNFLGTADDWAMMSIDLEAPNPASIAGDLYINGELLTDLNLTSATNINKGVFKEFKSLKTVHIPDTVNSIGKYSFDDCTGITNLTISNNVVNIEDYAFRNCSKLNSVTIPDSVTSIGFSAFNNCSALNTVYLGNSITSINRGAFCGCGVINFICENPEVEMLINSNNYDAFNTGSSLSL